MRLDVLVIGGDAAIGRATAARLHRIGWRVGVTSRRPGTAAYPKFPLELSTMSGIHALPDAAAGSRKARLSFVRRGPKRQQRLVSRGRTAATHQCLRQTKSSGGSRGFAA